MKVIVVGAGIVGTCSASYLLRDGHDVVLVDSYEPTGPLGAKSIAEIGINAPIPTLANAIYDAIGVRLTKTPFTPEKILAALQAKNT